MFGRNKTKPSYEQNSLMGQVRKALDNAGIHYKEGADYNEVIIPYNGDSFETVNVLLYVNEENERFLASSGTTVSTVMNRNLFLEALGFSNDRTSHGGRFFFDDNTNRVVFEAGCFLEEDGSMEALLDFVNLVAAWGDEELFVLKKCAEGEYNDFAEFKDAYLNC